MNKWSLVLIGALIFGLAVTGLSYFKTSTVVPQIARTPKELMEQCDKGAADTPVVTHHGWPFSYVENNDYSPGCTLTSSAAAQSANVFYPLDFILDVMLFTVPALIAEGLLKKRGSNG